MKERKTISQDTYLKVIGLYTIAHQHYTKCREFERAMLDILGLEDQGCVCDEIYSDQPWSKSEFDKGLQNDGFTVEPAPVISQHKESPER